MALDFPSGASMGSVYTGTNGTVYVYDGVKWRISSSVNDLVPTSGGTYDLGSTSTTWNSLYVNRVFIRSTATANSTGSGALQVVGGAGIGGSLYVGGTIYQNGIPVSGGGSVSTSTLVYGTFTVSINTSGNLSLDGISQRLDFADTVSTIYAVDPDISGGVSGLNLIGKDRLYVTIADSTGTWSYNWDFRSFGLNDYSTNSKPTMKFPGNGYLMTDFTTGFGQNRPITLASSHHLNLVAGDNTEPGQFGGYVKLSSGLGDDGYGSVIIDTGNYEFTFGSNGKLVLNPVGHFIDASVPGLFTIQSATTSSNSQFDFYSDGAMGVPGLIYNKGTSNIGQLLLQGDVGESATYLALPSDVGSTTYNVRLANQNGGIQLYAGANNWLFNNAGQVVFPNGTTSTGYTVYVPYATSSSFQINLQTSPMNGSVYLPYEFSLARLKLPSGNGGIQSGTYGDLWFLDSANQSFQFPNISRINYGDGGYLSTGTLQVDVREGGIFQIRLNDSNKTWIFNNSGNIVFPDGTTQTTAFVSGSIGGYTPSTVGNWGTPTVTTISAALDELAQRTTTVESIAGVTGTNVTNVFMYNSNASYSMTQNVEYKIPFDTATTGNDAGDFQTTSSQFIPQIAGWYLLETHLNFGGVWSGNVNISVYKNNNQEKLIGTSWIGNGGGVGGSAMVYCNGTTDIIEIRATQTSGGVQALEQGATKTWFQATWMKS